MCRNCDTDLAWYEYLGENYARKTSPSFQHVNLLTESKIMKEIMESGSALALVRPSRLHVLAVLKDALEWNYHPEDRDADGWVIWIRILALYKPSLEASWSTAHQANRALLASESTDEETKEH